MLTRLFLLCIGICSMTLYPAHANTVTIPSEKIVPLLPSLRKITSLKIKDLEKLTGRKFSLKEKLAFMFIRHKLKKSNIPAAITEKGHSSLILGILSLSSILFALLAPFTIFIGLGLGIAAIITGSAVLKTDPSNKNAKTGRLLGWISILAIAIILFVLVILFSTNGFSFG